MVLDECELGSVKHANWHADRRHCRNAPEWMVAENSIESKLVLSNASAKRN